MFKTDSFILQIWLWNFVWLLVQKWNTVIRTAKLYPFNPSWLLNLVKKGCNSKLVKESELRCYQKITVVIILKLLKCQRLESELFTMFTIWYQPLPQRAQDNAEARLDGPTTDMSWMLAGLALCSLQKDHWWYDRVNKNKQVNENENKWNGTGQNYMKCPFKIIQQHHQVTFSTPKLSR